jgi:pimeloyl-ACP methyl ester carboxylesterase
VAEAAGDLAAAIRLTRRLTALDRLAEIPHRDLMRRLAAHGDRAAAVAIYDRLRERLADELGIAPSPATRTLAANIRTDGGVAAAAPRVGPSIVRYARGGGRAIAYQRFGGGTSDLLIVPGWASNLDAVWDFPPLGPLVARLGEIARCTVFDKRGTGLSDRDLDFGSLEARADDIRAVMDAAGLGRATLFAYSESAALALVFAAAYPERVEGLVLYSAYARLIEEPGYHGGFERELVDAFLERVRSDWGAGTVSRVSFQGAPDTSAVRDLLARWERSICTPTMAAHIIRANAEIDVRPLLPTVRARTLVLHSTGDPIAPPALGRFVAGHLPNATYVEREAAYHLPWDSGEAWFVEEVARFATGTGTPGRRAEPVLATLLVASGGVLDRDAVARCGGELTDATTALFTSPSRALDFAATLAAPAGAGLHTGEVVPGAAGGAAVRIAHGVAALAAPGEVLVSRTVRDLTAGSARRFKERGRHAFAAVAPAEWEVFRYLP